MGITLKCWQDDTEWHDWFAWHPVWLPTFKDGEKICQTRAWLVTIQRRFKYQWGDRDVSYRLKGGQQ